MNWLIQTTKRGRAKADVIEDRSLEDKILRAPNIIIIAMFSSRSNIEVGEIQLVPD